MTVYVDDMRAPYGRMVLCHQEPETAIEALMELHHGRDGAL